MLKNIKRLLVIVMLLIPFVFIKASASSWRYEWENTLVEIPLYSSKEDYRKIPVARLYKDDKLCQDAAITYLSDGDWLCYFKDINTSKVGTYYVWYKAFENTKYKPGTCPGYKSKVTFIVRDVEAPEITVANKICRIRRGSEFNPKDNVFVRDNYDTEIDVITSNDYNVDKIGKYTISISAADSSGNTTQASYELEVYEDTPPTISYKNEGTSINIPVKGTFDVSEFFEASDVVDGDITSKIKCDGKIDLSKVASKDYTFYVLNSAGLRSETTVTINVIDSMKPIINLTNSSITLDYLTDFDSIDYKKYIKSIEDSSDIDYDNLTYKYDMTKMVGTYHIWYTYKNSLYESTVSLEVKLVSKIKPTLAVENVSMTVGDSIDLLDYVTVSDASDLDIESKIVITDDSVDYNTAGTYYAEVYVSNSSGLSATKKMRIIVVEEETEEEESVTNDIVKNVETYFSGTEWILIALLITIALGICLLLWQRKKNKSI